ncbi:hypothetical protein Dxin01_03982 [Deinococcus xinjiangensis]|uniref:Uncharacterized protein n=1 Tax=Deinococcus xinjiangensis TaxID=457454 RepID=A0ABP9VJE0_9DEIO
MPLSPTERARRGGQATALKYGHPHMSTIGYAGMLIVAGRYFGNDVAAMMQYVRNAKNHPDQQKAIPFHTAV